MNDEERVSDYVDGRLPPAERAAFEERLRADPALDRRIRLARAMKAALKASAPPMPADLKAALKRQARVAAARDRVSWLDAWRAALSAGPWAYGAGAAAFAGAALILAVRLSAPARRPRGPAGGKPAAAAWSDAAAAQGLERLWSDDDGSDNDEG